MSNFGQGGIIVTKPVFLVKCERIKKQSWYKVRFQMNNQLVERIQALPKSYRTFDVEDHCWHLHVKGLYDIIKMYKRSEKIKFEFGVEGRLEFIEMARKIDEIEVVKINKLAELKLKNDEAIEFKKELEKNYKKYELEVLKHLRDGVALYPHQIVGAMFLKKVKSGLLALEQGLGKTLVSIAYVELMGFNKVLIVVPASLKFNFYDEIIKYSKSGTAHVVNYKHNRYTINEAKYIIINYEYFNNKKYDKVNVKYKELDLGMIECVICDESSKLKNVSSNTYKNFKKLFKEVPSKIFMSGTPMHSRASELYTTLNQLSPLEFPNKKFFYETYCGLIEDISVRGGWRKEEKLTKYEDLFYKIEPFVYRKRKIEVLKDLPDKIYQKIIIDLTEEQEILYNKIEEGVANEIFSQAEMSSVNVLTTMLRLRQYTSKLKKERICEIIDEIIGNNEKCVVLDVFKDSIYELHEKYKPISVIHTGDQSIEERNIGKVDFQNPNGKSKIFFGSIQSSSFGLTLTAASSLFVNTLPFTVSELDQASDRIHRIGSKNTCYIYLPIIKDSIDEYIYKMIEKKRIEITKVLDNEDYKSNIEESVIFDLLKYLKEKYKK